MSTGAAIADQIAPALPYLRRFARALTGSQDSGDSYVVATLEAMIADRSVFRRDLPARIALFHAFIRVWRSLPINQAKEPDSGHATMRAADRRIERLTPLTRQAFLLTALEEFSTDEVAAILGVATNEVALLVTDAGKEIAAQITARVLIIEDEPMIALDIETLVTEIGHTPVGIATTRNEARAMARKTKPDIVLSDIQLADGSSGIDAVNDILKEMNVPVIFITAYPERLLTGERAEPTFLITKPFQPTMVMAIVSQALFFDMKAKGGQPTSAGTRH